MTVDVKKRLKLDIDLLVAARKGNIDLARALLTAGASTATVEMGKTPLLWAVISGHREMTRLLLEAGAEMYAHDGCFHTGFHYAVQYDRPDIADLFIARGFDVDYQRNRGYSNAPIHLAIYVDDKGDGSFPRVEYLLSRGARTDVVLIRNGVSFDVASHAENMNLTHLDKLRTLLVSYPLKKERREEMLKTAPKAKIRFKP